MTEREGKIHALGPKKLSSSVRPFYQTAPQATFAVTKPAIVISPPVPKPQIRYIMVQHPQFDTLTQEFKTLRIMYDDLLVKFEQKNTQESLRANIQEVIESTQNIEIKMSRIVEDANNNMVSQEQQQNNQQLLQAEKARHEQQCMQIIETVNKATQKIEELQAKNKSLKSEIQTHKEWRQALQKENKRLREMFQIMERQKQEVVESLKNQIKMLKEKQQQQQSNKRRVQMSIINKSIINETENEEIDNNNSSEKKIESRVDNSSKKQQIVYNSREKISESRSNQQQKVESRVQNQKIVESASVLRKINNSQYLVESQVVGEEVSGFSRLSINGEGSKKSRVYL